MTVSAPAHRDQGGLFGWWRAGTPAAHRALIAAALGWMLDSFDVMLYALVLTSIMSDLGDRRGHGGRAADPGRCWRRRLAE